jgi:hypothetical protein
MKVIDFNLLITLNHFQLRTLKTRQQVAVHTTQEEVVLMIIMITIVTEVGLIKSPIMIEKLNGHLLRSNLH